MSYSRSLRYPHSKNLNLNIRDLVTFTLYPNKFFVEGIGFKSEVDLVPGIYNEKSRKFLINPNMQGIVEEFFLNRKSNEEWVVMFNYHMNCYFSVPRYNIQRIEVVAP